MQLKSHCLCNASSTYVRLSWRREMVLSLLLLVCLLPTVSCQREATVSWAALVAELGSHAAIAGIASPATRIFTSHDRTGGNDDYSNGFVVTGDGWLTLAKLKGPGVLTRFWFTGIGIESRIRFLFDGESEPRFEATVEDFYAGKTPFVAPLCHGDQYCFTSYLPIPYKRQLRVQVSDDEYSKGKGKLYFQINATPFVRRSVQSAVFPIPTYVQAVIGKLEDQWSEKIDVGSAVAATQTIASGQRAVVGGFQGGGVITGFRLGINNWAELDFESRSRLLSELWVEAYWDGAEQPSVCAPLGAFSGVLWQPLSYRSMFLGADKGAFFNHFPMPFRRNARFEVFNTGKTAVELSVDIQHSGDVATTEAAYFHCGWSRSGADKVGRSHQVLDVSGRGRLAGCILGVASRDKSFWVLESDETIIRDGQKDVFWQGTGLEDYFNGGWYYRSVFVEPLYGLIQKRPYRTLQYRFHLNDAITFEKDLRMSFERGPGNQSKADFDSAVYYYLAEPSQAFGQSAGTSMLAPQDPLAASSLMTRLWDYERFGDLDNARSLLKHAIDTFGFDAVWREVLELRRLDYTAQIDGFASVREKIQGMSVGESPVAIMAQQLSDVYEGRSVLFSLYASKPTELWLNNKIIARAETPLQPIVAAVPLSQGKFSLAARSEKAAWPHWVQVAYRTAQLSGGVDRSWRAQIEPKGRWTEPGYDDARWTSVKSYAKGPPEMEAVPFVAPNPFVMLHSQAEGVRPQIAGHEGAGMYVLRKVLELE